jgi:hypothetical protein
LSNWFSLHLDLDECTDDCSDEDEEEDSEDDSEMHTMDESVNNRKLHKG